MKRFLHSLTALFLISGISLAGASPAPPAVSDLVHVDADLTSDHKDPKSGPAEIIDYKLKLRLTNHLKEPTGPIQIRITFHNRDLVKRSKGVEKTINLKADIKGRGTYEMTSDVVTFHLHSRARPTRQIPARHRPLQTRACQRKALCGILRSDFAGR